MVDHARREQVTLLLINDALEANGQDVAEAAFHLLDAAGSLIVHAHRTFAKEDEVITAIFAKYLVDQVERHAEGGQ